MTHAELIEQRRPEMAAATMLDLAKGWYDRTHPQADAETASTAAKLTAWLAAEIEEGAEQEAAAREPESTIVTTLQVTHVVRGIASPEEALTQQIAENAVRCAWAGYHEHVLSGGHPDDISIGSVQVFPREAEEPEPEGSAE